MIFEIAHKTVDTVTKWPRLICKIDSVEGQVLLGTPNGSSVAFTLV